LNSPFCVKNIPEVLFFFTIYGQIAGNKVRSKGSVPLVAEGC
jgi:hypothetical protein